MYTNVSDTFLAKLAEPSRHFSARFTVDGSVINDVEVKNIECTAGTCGGSDFAIGCAYASYIQVTVDSIGQLMEGKEAFLELGLLLDDGTYEYVPFGYWTVQKPTAQGNVISFQAVDRMAAKLNGAYSTSLTYPATVASVLSELSSKTGVIINCTLQTGVRIQAPIMDVTNRGALAIIAGVLLANAWCDRNGEIQITSYNADYSQLNLDYDYVKSEPAMDEQPTIIGGVKIYTVANSTDTWISVGSGHMVELSNIYVSSNTLDTVKGNIVGMRYDGGSIAFMGNPLIDPSDFISWSYQLSEHPLETDEEEPILTDAGDELMASNTTSGFVPCMEIRQSFDGGLLTTVTAPGSFEVTESTISLGPVTEALQQQQKEITTAQETADDALETASNAVVLANGKNKIFYQDSAPTSGMAVGDLWMDTNGGNALYEYKSTGWTLRQLGQGSLVAGSVTANEIAANTITANEIASRTITASKIATGAITANEIAADTITGSKIASNTITADELNVSNLSAISANLGTITGGSIDIGSGNFTVTQSGYLNATGAVISGEINANTGTVGPLNITSYELYSGTATDWNIGDGIYIGLDSSASGNYRISTKKEYGTNDYYHTYIYPQGLVSERKLTATERSYAQLNGNWLILGSSYDASSSIMLNTGSGHQLTFSSDLNGNATINGNYILTASSDIRLKHNIESTEVTDALSILNAINLRSFDWNDDAQTLYDGTHWPIGMIADELEQIDKKLVGGGRYNEDGTICKKFIDTFYMTGYLIKAIQELSEKVTCLENELAKLKKGGE